MMFFMGINEQSASSPHFIDRLSGGKNGELAGDSIRNAFDGAASPNEIQGKGKSSEKGNERPRADIEQGLMPNPYFDQILDLNCHVANAQLF